MLSSIIWNVDPTIFAWGGLQVRWYGLIYALGFFVAITIIGQTFKHDKAPEEWLDKVFIYMILAVIVGARLGHVFFYGWAYYSQHLWEIPMVWKGGLASHGGALAMIPAAWLLSKYMTKQNIFWLGDRVFIGSALQACFIRIANLMNSEIYGTPTDLPWGFVFMRGQEKYYDEMGNLLPCHPTQLYEALAYFTVFVILMYLYWRRDAGRYNGLLTGIGFVGIFLSRQIIEIIKNPQEEFEVDMMFNMGQWLSVPFVIFGTVLIIRALRNGPVEYHLPQQTATAPAQTNKKQKR